MVLGMSDQEVIYDENGDINQDHVLDDYQKNPKGLAPGDVVVVAAKGLKFYHVRKYKVSSRLLDISCHFTIIQIPFARSARVDTDECCSQIMPVSRGNSSVFEWLAQSKE